MRQVKRAAIIAAWFLGCHMAAVSFTIILAYLLEARSLVEPTIIGPVYLLLFGALLVTTSRKWSWKRRVVKFAGFAVLALLVS